MFGESFPLTNLHAISEIGLAFAVTSHSIPRNIDKATKFQDFLYHIIPSPF
jgi:hypothetical protein